MYRWTGVDGRGLVTSLVLSVVPGLPRSGFPSFARLGIWAAVIFKWTRGIDSKFESIDSIDLSSLLARINRCSLTALAHMVSKMASSLFLFYVLCAVHRVTSRRSRSSTPTMSKPGLNWLRSLSNPTYRFVSLILIIIYICKVHFIRRPQCAPCMESNKWIERPELGANVQLTEVRFQDRLKTHSCGGSW